MLYALALVPVTLASSGAVDYARAVVVRTSMSAALDAAALAVAQSKGLPDDQMKALALQYFNANYHQNADCPVASVNINKSGRDIQVSTSCAMPTTILKLIGMNQMNVGTTSTITYGQTKLWVSLVLDNTGSMNDHDSTGLTKMTALKNASYSLLTMLQNASSTPGDVQVAIIPFTNDVNVGTGSKSWIDWTFWDTYYGNCNISGKTNAMLCKVKGTWTPGYCSSSRYTTEKDCTGARKTWTPDSCNIPGYTSQTTCTAAIGTWTPTSHSNWTGCVTDRGTNTAPVSTSDYDVTNAAPVSGQAASLFPADQTSGCPLTLMGLNYSWTNLNSQIKNMAANGSTNQTIGLVWGWHALTQGAPLSPPALPDQTQRVIIILSDGFNTKYRWGGDGLAHLTAADDRMAKVCANAKADNIVIYAVFLDINGAQGNSTVLQNCATDISKYYDLTSAGDVQKAFTDIGNQITNLRVSR